MDINVTLFGQMITFAVFVWFTMKYVWPPITKAMQEREKKIADGLAAGEKGQRDLELARHKSIEIIQEAKTEAARIIDQANKRAQRIVEEGKVNARLEGDRLLQAARADIDQLMVKTKRDLQHQVSGLAIIMAEKIIQRDIDTNTHRELLEQIVTEI